MAGTKGVALDSHDDFRARRFKDNNGRPDDDGGHGTHNAGIIAANLNNLGVAGMGKHTN